MRGEGASRTWASEWTRKEWWMDVHQLVMWGEKNISGEEVISRYQQTSVNISNGHCMDETSVYYYSVVPPCNVYCVFESLSLVLFFFKNR